MHFARESEPRTKQDGFIAICSRVQADQSLCLGQQTEIRLGLRLTVTKLYQWQGSTFVKYRNVFGLAIQTQSPSKERAVEVLKACLLCKLTRSVLMQALQLLLCSCLQCPQPFWGCMLHLVRSVLNAKSTSCECNILWSFEVQSILV